MNWCVIALKNSFNSSGRASRFEYWTFSLAYLAISLSLAVVDSLMGTMSKSGYGLLDLIFSTIFLIPSLSVTVRRLHDIDHSGWWLLSVIVPICLMTISVIKDNKEAIASSCFLVLISISVFIIVTMFKGTVGANDYGPDSLD